MLRYIALFGLLFLYALTPAIASSQEEPPTTRSRPNILLIVVDDMGFTDLGSFGGEIPTPQLDALALSGIRFTNFQAAPTCSPTRAMLLTGVDNHKAGLGNMQEEMAPNQKGKPGYEGHLIDRVVTMATLLRDAGYHTYMAGKWHLGLSDDTSPAARGFDRSFAMLTGGASHFGDMKPAYSPTLDAVAPYRENGTLLQKLPEDFEYSTRFYADRLIENIEENREQVQPFFAYLAYTAPHWPLQAPGDVLNKYRGRYDAGYDVLQTQRFEKQKALGLLPDSAKPASYSIKGQPWAQLSGRERQTEARQMEIYAAMINEIDTQTGRVIDYLKGRGLFENTVVIFLSDNGAEGHDLNSTWDAQLFPKIRNVIDSTHDFSFDNMGKPGSYVFVGEGWARAGSPALRHYKGATTEGGTRVAAFVHYPKLFRVGAIEQTMVSVKDIAPTLLDLTGVQHPGQNYRGRSVEPMTGISMLLLLQQGKLPVAARQRVLGIELMGKRAMRQGDWKVVHMPEPYGTGSWQLFDLAEDLSESRDVSQKYPGKLRELKRLWSEYSDENKVILPDFVSGY